MVVYVRMVEWWNGHYGRRIVELSNSGMVVDSLNRRVVEWVYMVELSNGGMAVESSNDAICSNLRMVEWLLWQTQKLTSSALNGERSGK